MNFKEKRLYKSRDKIISGICGGIAEYVEIDPTIVRFLWIGLCFAGGMGFWLYLVGMFIMPDPPYDFRR